MAKTVQVWKNYPYILKMSPYILFRQLEPPWNISLNLLIFRAILNEQLKLGMMSVTEKAKLDDMTEFKQEIEMAIKNLNGYHNPFLPKQEAMQVRYNHHYNNNKK